MADIKLAIILGTKRKNNKSQHMWRYSGAVAEQHGAFEVTMVDPQDFDMPDDGNDEYARDEKFTKIVKESDAFFIIVPEYNHSFTGSLKRMLDTEYTLYRHKAVAMAGVSSGKFSGVRAMEALAPVLRNFGLAVAQADVHVANSYEAFNDDDSPRDEAVTERLNQVLDELEWLAKAMKWGRENLDLKD